MFLGNDTVTVLEGGEELAISGCRITGNHGLVPYPLEDKQVLLIGEDGRRYVARDVVAWYNAAGAFDHAEGTFEAVQDADGERQD
jgi:hypothetical protein